MRPPGAHGIGVDIRGPDIARNCSLSDSSAFDFSPASAATRLSLAFSFSIFATTSANAAARIDSLCHIMPAASPQEATTTKTTIQGDFIS